MADYKEEQERVSATVTRSTLIGGSWYGPGDEVEVLRHQLRDGVKAGYFEGSGDIREQFGPGELENNADKVGQNPDERDDIDAMPDVDEYFAIHDVGQGAEGETHDGSSASGSSSEAQPRARRRSSEREEA